MALAAHTAAITFGLGLGLVMIVLVLVLAVKAGQRVFGSKPNHGPRGRR